VEGVEKKDAQQERKNIFFHYGQGSLELPSRVFSDALPAGAWYRKHWNKPRKTRKILKHRQVQRKDGRNRKLRERNEKGRIRLSMWLSCSRGCNRKVRATSRIGNVFGRKKAK
jgi:hypothetical protein